MKKLLLTFFTLLIVAALSACGSSSDSKSDSASNAKKDGDALAQIKEKGVLTVGTEGTYAPYTYHDPDTNKLIGFDVDVIREVGKRLGVKVEFKESNWDSLFAGLNAKRFDTIANNVGVTPERQDKYDLSTPFYSSKAVIVTKKDNKTIKGLSDLKGVKVAQGLSSNYGEMAKKAGGQIVAEDDLSKALKLVSQGRVDATVNDQGAVLQYFNQTKDKNLKVATVLEENASDIVFPALKGNGLTEAFTKELNAMKKDGTLTKLSKQYFNKDITK